MCTGRTQIDTGVSQEECASTTVMVEATSECGPYGVLAEQTEKERGCGARGYALVGITNSPSYSSAAHRCSGSYVFSILESEGDST